MSGDASRAAIAHVARAMGPELGHVVFVGGTVPALYDLPPGFGVRPTDDVDCIAQVRLAEYYALTDRLRARGFDPCADDGAPLCRSVCGPYLVDLMPTEPTPVGPSNRWYPEAFAKAREYQVAAGVTVRAIAPIYFVATKLVAFGSRGGGRFADSEDVEDAVLVLSGLRGLRDDVEAAATPVAAYVRAEFAAFHAAEAFRSALRGFFTGDVTGEEHAAAFAAWLGALRRDFGSGRPR